MYYRYRMYEYVPQKHAGVLYAVKSNVVFDRYTKAYAGLR
jgi:hypothetical protein